MAFEALPRCLLVCTGRNFMELWLLRSLSESKGDKCSVTSAIRARSCQNFLAASVRLQVLMQMQVRGINCTKSFLVKKTCGAGEVVVLSFLPFHSFSVVAVHIWQDH